MSEVLSQGEVDALLRGVGDGEIETETDEAAEEVSGAVNYDLTSQEKIIRGRMPIWISSTRCFPGYSEIHFLP